MKIQFTIITTLFVFCGGTPVPPTTRRPILLQDPAIVEVGPASRDPSVAGPSGVSSRPESPAYDDGGENQDPFFQEREHQIDDATWALWNQNPNRDCPWWQQHR